MADFPDPEIETQMILVRFLWFVPFWKCIRTTWLFPHPKPRRPACRKCWRTVSRFQRQGAFLWCNHGDLSETMERWGFL